MITLLSLSFFVTPRIKAQSESDLGVDKKKSGGPTITIIGLDVRDKNLK
jgi:hypothetical protein